MDFECTLCGRDVEEQPPAACDVCHGRADTAPKQYTLSDHRARRAPQENRLEGLSPKESPLVVGGHVAHPGHRQN